jgi:hypothetical protein
VIPLAATGPARTVHHADALGWLRGAGRLAGASVVTSLPDVSELPGLGLDGWRRWFDEAATLVAQSVPDEGVAIFFQSDVRRAGLWLDKGAMVARAAEGAGMVTLFHKIVCRKPPGTLTHGRASYSHLLGFARVLRPTLRRLTPDVLPDGGFQPGVKAMGVAGLPRRVPVRHRRDHHPHHRRSLLRVGDGPGGGQRDGAGCRRRGCVSPDVQARPAPHGVARSLTATRGRTKPIQRASPC